MKYICPLGNFQSLLSSVEFFQNQLFRFFFRNTIWVSNRLDPDQARHVVWPDLGPICLQRFTDDTSSRQCVFEISSKCRLLMFRIVRPNFNDIVSIESYSGIRVALTKDVKPW